MKDKLLQIIRHYGINNQQRKLEEEVFELQQAIITQELDESGYNYEIKHIAEEIADCYVLLEQFRHYYSLNDEDIINNMDFKINRQIERIKENE